MVLTKLLASKGFLTVNKTLVKSIGLYESVLLAELCSEFEYFESKGELTGDGYFYCTASKLEIETSLSERQQREPLKTLKELGFIKSKLKGSPAKMHYKIDDENEKNLFQFLQNVKTSLTETPNKFLQNVETSFNKMSKQDFTFCQNINNNINNKNIITISELSENEKLLKSHVQTMPNVSSDESQKPNETETKSQKEFACTSNNNLINDADELTDFIFENIDELYINKYNRNYEIMGFNESYLRNYILKFAKFQLDKTKSVTRDFKAVEKLFSKQIEWIIKEVNSTIEQNKRTKKVDGKKKGEQKTDATISKSIDTSQMTKEGLYEFKLSEIEAKWSNNEFYFPADYTEAKRVLKFEYENKMGIFQR